MAIKIRLSLFHLSGVYDSMGTDVVVKSQVLAGGRGLGHVKENGFQGGVHVAKDKAHALDLADKMMGKTLVLLLYIKTKQSIF